MADNLPLAFQTEFDARVQLAYQASAQLLDKCYTKNNIVGKYCQFRRRGKGSALPHVRNSPLTPLGIDTIVATVELTDWDAPERLDPFDLAKINWDDMSVVSEALGRSIGRRSDQIKIDAMQAGVTQTVPVDYGTTGTSSALNMQKINRARQILLKNNVPSEGTRWFAAISASSLESLLNDKRAINNLYNPLRPLMEGEVKHYCGFEFIVIGDRDEGGLPINPTTGYRSCYFWEEKAYGYADAIIEGGNGMRTRMDWSPDYGGWLLNARLSAGAKVIETLGLIEVLIDESKPGLIVSE